MENKNVDDRKVRAIAGACYTALISYERERRYLERMIRRYGDHPAFKSYEKDLGLSEGFSRFRAQNK